MLQPTKKPLLNAMYHSVFGHDVIVEAIVWNLHTERQQVLYRVSNNDLVVMDLENGHSGWNDPVHTSEGAKSRFALVELV